MLLFRSKMIKVMHYLFLSRLFVPILFFCCCFLHLFLFIIGKIKLKKINIVA